MVDTTSRRPAVAILLGSLLTAVGCGGASPTRTLRHVSFDPTREFYQDINDEFVAQWKARTREEIAIEMSHGGSGKQARSVIEGLDADVVSLALAFDIDAIAERGKMIRPDWRDQLPGASVPFASTIVFLVRPDNPKGVRDWEDLTRSGVQVITPNPKTSGGARWNYLAAWGYAIRRYGGDELKARAFVEAVYRNVPVLDSGARGSTTTFAQRGLGDVLVTWENEARMAMEAFGAGRFEIVTPPSSILAETPVAVVDSVVDKRGTRALAEAYLKFLYSETGRALAVKHHFRAGPAGAATGRAAELPGMELFTIEQICGSWRQAHDRHFAAGAMFDQIYRPDGVK